MRIRDRIRQLRRVKAAELRPHPNNWRRHPDAQRDALRGLLAEVGYADALLVRELEDGSLQLIDGHLRAEITPEAEVPVLVLDLDDQETAKLLALHDPLAGLAEPDDAGLAGLLAEVETEDDALEQLIEEMLGEATCPPDAEPETDPPPEVAVPDSFQVVVECRDETQQKAVYERMTAEGFKCRVLTL